MAENRSLPDRQTRDGWRERLSTLALKGDLLRMADEAARAYEEVDRLRSLIIHAKAALDAELYGEAWEALRVAVDGESR